MPESSFQCAFYELVKSRLSQKPFKCIFSNWTSDILGKNRSGNKYHLFIFAMVIEIIDRVNGNQPKIQIDVESFELREMQHQIFRF